MKWILMGNSVFNKKRRGKILSGRYRSSGKLSLELRVDIDGYRPVNKVSGDFFIARGKTRYVGSFISDITKKPKIKSGNVIFEGKCKFTWNAQFSKIQVKIQCNPQKSTPRKATIQFLSEDGTLGGKYDCNFESNYFRTVQYEQDVEEGVKPFESYDTSSLEGGGPDRRLSVEVAFAEAGIEIQRMPSNIINSHKEWADEELKHLMKKYFNLLKDEPQWKVWLFAANKQERGSSKRGTIICGKRPRQGCVVFHYSINGSDPVSLREQIWTYVHELGHCFNLLHSHQKARSDSVIENRPYALSWMNFPHYYPDGSSEYWKKFEFQFDDEEIIHLRHGFRNDVIMGGNDFRDSKN
jgi:hypothetical protein